MTRFLAVYSKLRFRSIAQIRKVVVNFPIKNQKIFFSHAPLQITEKSQKDRWDALSNTFHRSIQNEGRNTFFHFFIRELNKK